MSESSAGEVLESLGATCTIPGATTISWELTGGVATPATISGARPHRRSCRRTDFLGSAGVPEGDRAGVIVLYAAMPQEILRRSAPPKSD